MTDPELAAIRPTGTPDRERVIRLRDGRRLAWSEFGPARGRPVLLLHGMPGSGHLCPDLAATVAAGVRVIAPDRPGYGASDPQPGRTMLDVAADVGELLDALAIASLPVVGWSSGVGFALACAAGLPSRVTRLELAAGDAPIDELEAGAAAAADLARVAARRSDPATARAQALERGRWFAESPESILGPEAPAGAEADAAASAPDADAAAGAAAGAPDAALRQQVPGLRPTLLAMFRHAARQGAVGWADDGIAIDLPWGFSLRSISQPATVWFGAGDALARRSDSERIAELVPDARLVVMPDDGHSLPVRRWAAILGDALGSAATR